MSERTTTSEVLHVLPVVEEVPRIVRRRRVTGRVRVAVTTSETSEAVEAVLRRRDAEVTRVPIGREVESPPPVRQEGDVLIVPVLEERLVLVRRLVLTEEVHLRLSTQEERVSLPASVMRQAAEVERVAVTEADAEPETPIAAEHFEDHPTMMRTITAMFDSRAEAERAREALIGLGLSASQVQMHPTEDLTTQATSVRKDSGFMASLANMFMPDEDRHTYSEGMRRGHFMISAEVEERHMDHAMDALEAAGAVDLDTREAEWRNQGWQGAAAAGGTGAVIGTSSSSDATGVSAMPGDATMGTAGMARTDASASTSTAQGLTGREEAIPIIQESLRVGKREARAGRVRVRSYVVETPVEEQVRLREEHVHVERRPVNREVTGTDGAMFQDRVIEATESVEEAVVQKDARVVEEVVVSKEATEHTETVRDTVRRTEVEVDKDAANDQVRPGNKGVA
ncbi:MAG TPA: YsnF/AvaK domain-containing protein [Acetobacteraceae bacterium]|nr:YsnF/AvaK domain-containing protein [Acetobacteraceae bacterium]